MFDRLLRSSAPLLAIGLAVVARPPLVSAQEIQRIEINQGIGVQKNNNLKFVAGKDAVVRAIMAASVRVDPARSRARITRDGTLVATLEPRTSGSVVTVVDFACPSRSACGNWAAGDYVFDVTVNDVSRSTAGTAHRFVERARMRVLGVPLRTKYGSTIRSVEGDGWRSLWQFTRDVYPVAPANFQWTARAELDVTAFDIETDVGQREVWQAVANLQPARCAANKEADGCFDKIIGFIPVRLPPNGMGQGYTMGAPANIVVASDQDAAATVAHEIAHNYDIGDAYDGGDFNCTANPVPDAFSGKDLNTRQPVRCTAGRVALPGVDGTRVPAAHHPYEVGGRGALPDMAEFMGSSGEQSQYWASQDTWDWIFDKLAPGGAGQSAALRGAASAMTETLVIEFSGFIRRDAAATTDVVLDPWQAFLDTATIADTTGPFMVAAIDATGARVASSAFTPVFELPGPIGQPSQVLDQAPFRGALRFPDETVAFQIIRDGRVVREVAVSENAPTVADVSPGAGTFFNGPAAITWSAADVDGDALWYTVEYNPDVTRPDTEFEILVADIRDRRWMEDFSELAGGDHAKIRVWASDGFNSTSADSPEFRVPFKPPEVAIEPPESTTVSATDGLWLDADVWDPQDDLLSDDALVWRSSVSGVIGTGELLTVYDLPLGEHVITLTATNRAGLTASASLTVTVVEGGHRR